VNLIEELYTTAEEDNEEQENSKLQRTEEIKLEWTEKIVQKKK